MKNIVEITTKEFEDALADLTGSERPPCDDVVRKLVARQMLHDLAYEEGFRGDFDTLWSWLERKGYVCQNRLTAKALAILNPADQPSLN